MTPAERPLSRAAAILISMAALGVLLGISLERAQVAASPDTPDPSSAPAPVSRPEEPRDLAPLRALAALPPYKDATPRPLAEDYLGPNAPAAVAWFSTPDSPDEVLAFYRNALAAEGHLLVEHHYGPSAGYVGYLAPDTEELHLVSVLAQGRETLVFTSVAKLSQSLAGTWPSELPCSEGAVERLSLSLPPEAGGRSVAARIPVGSLGGVLDAYRRALVAAGWEVEPTEGDADQARLTAHRGGTSATAYLRRAPDGVHLYINLPGADSSGAQEQDG